MVRSSMLSGKIARRNKKNKNKKNKNSNRLNRTALYIIFFIFLFFYFFIINYRELLPEAILVILLSSILLIELLEG